MKKRVLLPVLFFIGVLFFSNQSNGQQNDAGVKPGATELKTYLIEREITGAGKFSPGDLKSISQKSCTVLKEMGPAIIWVHSYVTENKIFCIYRAENENLLREHAKKGGFPVTSITQVNSTISPKTAE